MATDALDAYRGFSYEVAQLLAPNWERRRADVERICAPVRGWMLRELAPRPGATLLELAAGTGDTGFEAAKLIGNEGRVIVSDFSPAMVDAARRRGAELEVTNVDYRVLDAERIDLGDDHVDGIMCRFAYMLMADQAAALAETRRVLRQGGRLVLAVWGARESNPFFAMVAEALVQRGLMSPPEPPPAPGLFAMASTERTTAMLQEAGFDDVRIEEVQAHFVLPDADEYVSIVADLAGPLAMALRKLSGAEREAVRDDLEKALTPFAIEGGYELPATVLCAVAA